MHSVSLTAVNGAVTAAEPTDWSNAATDEAWQRRVQWSTLFVWKPVLINFWNI